MASVIEAVYEEGVFRPRNPVDLTNGTVVELSIRATGGDVRCESSPEDVNRYMDEVAALYDPSDGEDAFSGADHDKVLYSARGAA